MTFDTRARDAAAQAHSSVHGVEPVQQLEALEHELSRRRRAKVAVVAGVVVVTLVVNGWLAVTRPGDPGAPRPVGPPTSTPTHVDQCGNGRVACQGPRRYRVNLDVPVAFRLPRRFEEGVVAYPGDTGVEVYRTDSQRGVAIIEHAVPARYDASWSPDPAAGRTALSMAHWLADRPYLTGTQLTPTTVGGLPAWRVTGRLGPGADLTARKGDKSFLVAPAFSSGDEFFSGYSQRLRGEFTLVDVAGAGVTAIWSWSYDPEKPSVVADRPFVESLSFG